MITKKITSNSRNQSALKDTSCGRYEATQSLLNQALPTNTAACFTILNNKDVKMTITVQQMVFNAQLGLVEVRDM